MEWYVYAAVIATGFVAGFINTLAGSGSLLTLPLLMFLGLPANMANGTNRIAILLQNVIGAGSFKKQQKLDVKTGLWLGIPTILGSLAGAQIAVSFSDALMEKAIGFVLILMFFVILARPKRWLRQEQEYHFEKISFPQIIIFFLIGVYGGFVQAGVGIFLLAGLVLGIGADLIRANALKVFIILLYTPIALAVFMLNDQVNYTMGLILATGNMLGAFAGSRVAVSWGPKFIRVVLLAAIVLSAFKLLGIFSFLNSLLEKLL